MKIYDITQELFSCEVFPGDPQPKKEVVTTIEKSGICNLSAISLCTHNGTHVDAPYHFFDDGNTIDKIPLEKLVGYCYLTEHKGILGEKDATDILTKSHNCKKILIKGDVTVSLDAAKVFAKEKIDLIGNESQTVGPKDAPMAVHRELLSVDTVLLEGLRLGHVPCGSYLLSAAPVNLAGCDGSPCRAILIEL